MRPTFCLSIALAAATVGSIAHAQAAMPAASPMPAAGAQTVSIAVPAGAQLVLTARGDGLQIYSCSQEQGNWLWKLRAPEATLSDAQGKAIGKHSAGPTWQLEDGSAVRGAALASQPQVTAIPWLLLSAQSTGGAGRLQQVIFVQRTDTVGGRAPSTGCDAAHAQAETSVPYSAKYSFYSGNK